MTSRQTEPSPDLYEAVEGSSSFHKDVGSGQWCTNGPFWSTPCLLYPQTELLKQHFSIAKIVHVPDLLLHNNGLTLTEVVKKPRLSCTTLDSIGGGGV